MGASVAYQLTRRGVHDVVIVEREPLLGMGSTGRNAGGVRHQFSSEANVRLSIESIRLLERFNDDVGSEIDFHQDGYLFLLATPESVTSFRAGIDMQRRLGVEVDLLSPAEAQRLAPGLEVDGILAASYCARDGIADPNGVTMGFAKAAQLAGAEIYRETEVTGIRRTAGRISAVETTRGVISTPVVVNAAGPYAGRIGEMAGLDIPVYPLRRPYSTEPTRELGRHGPSSRNGHRLRDNLLFSQGRSWNSVWDGRRESSTGLRHDGELGVSGTGDSYRCAETSGSG
jgi:sarcosine oxidase subunit beta